MRNPKFVGWLTFLFIVVYSVTAQFPGYKIVNFILFSLLLIIVSIAGFIAWYLIATYPRRKSEPGFEYIYVEKDGSARELDDDEKIYLKTEFHGGDGNRPYIKLRYESLTPDGKILGYLSRRQLPNNIEIKPAKPQK